jgi:hypothetical protein
MKSQNLSLFRMISTDYPSFLSVLFPIVFGGFSAYFFFTGNNALQLFLLLAIGAIVLGVPYLVQRYRTLSSVFADGIEAQGTVTNMFFFRGRGRVEYSYTVQGKKQTSSNAINKNSRTRSLKVGQTVTVVVDRNDPKLAFIKELYL